MTKTTKQRDEELSAHPEYEKISAENSEEMWQEVVSYYVNLNRKRRRITQKQIAAELRISQPGVCQMLKRPATVAKLWRLCRAMGGHLEVDFVYEGKRYSLLNEPPADYDEVMAGFATEK